MNKFIFLFLSIVSGMLELGGIVFGVSLKLPIEYILVIALAYQVGNLFPNPISLNKFGLIIISFISIMMLTFINIIEFKYSLFLMSYIMLNIVVQSMRALKKSDINTSVKRIFRMSGFLIVPFFSIKIILCISIILFFLSLRLEHDKSMKFKLINPKIKFINIVMIVHQMHYFCYVYFIIILMSSYLDKYKLILGVLFTLGWVSYTSVPHILKKSTYYKYLCIGHIWLAGILITIVLNIDNIYAITILWILTGFGGGTVFCINKINKCKDNTSELSMSFSENIGHVLGVAIGLLIFIVTKSMIYPVILSSIFAIMTVILISYYYFCIDIK